MKSIQMTTFYWVLRKLNKEGTFKMIFKQQKQVNAYRCRENLLQISMTKDEIFYDGNPLRGPEALMGRTQHMWKTVVEDGLRLQVMIMSFCINCTESQ